MDAGSVASDVAEAAHGAGTGIVAEFKKLGKSAFGQLLGKSDNEDLKHHEIKDMAKIDDKWSETEHAARIRAVYEEYYTRKKRQEKIEEEREEKEEEAKKLEELNEERVARSQMGISPQIAKTRAEIKNYGAE